MPLTTPLSALQDYGGDDQHFLHVLEHLFIPAITAAGHEPIKPIMRGSDLIHAEIIKNLEQADLVLCDVSLLNANVFFELGIRTALDRPVAMVKDDRTPTYPFDTSMINYHSYNSGLSAWTLADDIRLLVQHIRDSATRASGRNSLWRYFGLTQRAVPAEIQNPVEEKLDLLVREIEKMRAGVGTASRSPVVPRWPITFMGEDLIEGLPEINGIPVLDERVRSLLLYAAKAADEVHAKFVLRAATTEHVVLDLVGFGLNSTLVTQIQERAKALGIKLEIVGNTFDF